MSNIEIEISKVSHNNNNGTMDVIDETVDLIPHMTSLTTPKLSVNMASSDLTPHYQLTWIGYQFRRWKWLVFLFIFLVVSAWLIE